MVKVSQYQQVVAIIKPTLGDHTERHHMQKPLSPRLSQLRTRGQFLHCGSFQNSTRERSCKCYHNAHNTNLTYDPAHNSRDVPHIPKVESAGKPHNHYGYADRRALHMQHLHDHHINGNLSHENQYQQVYNPNLALNHQLTAPIKPVRTCSQ